MKRLIYCLLALFLVISTVSATAHGVVHQDNGYEQCLLCASHADAKPPAVGASFSFSTEFTMGKVPDSSIDTLLCARFAPVPQPRAPPLLS